MDKKHLEELSEIKAKLDHLSKTVKSQLEIKAEGTDNERIHQMMYSVYNYIDYIAKNLYGSLDYYAKSFWEHANNGHLPPILGPEKMENAIKKLGLDGDYSTQKRTIWANTKHGMVIEASYIKESK